MAYLLYCFSYLIPLILFFKEGKLFAEKEANLGDKRSTIYVVPWVNMEANFM